MRYTSGERIALGDKVQLWKGCVGTVVCDLDGGEFSELYPKSEWQYLQEGIVISCLEAGTIHYTDPDSLILVERAQQE